MYNAQMAAYQKVQKMGMTGREVEASALTKAAVMLRNCQANWDKGGSNGMLDEALRFNQMLWSILQTELCRPDHPMSGKLRQDLLRLSVFVDKRMFEVMAYPQSEKLNILIDINLNIAAGLRDNSSAGQ